MLYLDTEKWYVNPIISLYLNLCVSHRCMSVSNTVRVSVYMYPLLKLIQCFSSSAKKEEDDLEDKKSIKKRIKELKVLDPKIAQNLCKYLYPFQPTPSKDWIYTYPSSSWCYAVLAMSVVIASAAPHNTLCTHFSLWLTQFTSCVPYYMSFTYSLASIDNLSVNDLKLCSSL